MASKEKNLEENKLLKELEIDDWPQVEYYDQFSTIMENYKIINEAILIEIFLTKGLREIKEYLEFHFEDLMTGIANDNIDLYKIFSTVKYLLLGIASSIGKDKKYLDILAYELLRFQTWIMANELVLCTDLVSKTKSYISIYDSLLLTRLENLKSGSFECIYPDALDYPIDDYDIDFDDQEEELDAYDFDDIERDDDYEYSQGLIDLDNPVIDEI
ncbi:MAG: hypothetical protein WC996_05660 [Peptostreptococcales bacterium]